MPRAEMLTVFAYDISSDKRRRAVAKILDGPTVRVQGSVFEGRMSAARSEALVRRLTPFLDTGDSLRVYAIGADGLRRSSAHGASPPLDEGAAYWLM